MKKPIVILLTGSLLLPLWLAGCERPRGTVNETGASGKTQKPVAEQAEFTMEESPLKVEVNALFDEAERLLQAGDYATIERRIAQYRRTKETFIDGKSKLFAFYYGLGWIPSDADEALWKAREQLLFAWRKKHPDSIAARLSLVWLYYAGLNQIMSKTRERAPDPAEQQLKKQRIKQAQQELDATSAVKNQYPEWYMAAQLIAFKEKVPRAKFLALVNEGLARFPQQEDYHFNYIVFLRPSWGGAEGDWQEYAAEVADKMPGNDGNLFYARAVWFIIFGGELNGITELEGIDWPRARRGFELLMTQGDAASVSGAYAVAAWLSRDRETLKRLFEQHIGNNADRMAWKDYQQYTAARKWALGE